MPDKSKLEDRSIKDPSPQQLREELEKHVRHMLDHDPKRLEFALMITGHSEEDGGTHVCSMLGGSPQTLAVVVVDLMSELTKQDPTLALFFLLNALRRMRDHTELIVDIDFTGGPDTEAKVKDLLSKLQDSTPPNESIH